MLFTQPLKKFHEFKILTHFIYKFLKITPFSKKVIYIQIIYTNDFVFELK